MQYTSKTVRDDFIKFFLDKEHKFVRSSPVFPISDPTLLFINAGMNQFKNIFLGREKIEFKRVVNSQKCIRVSGKHNDLEEVGLDQFHHTFFEMLGNWSFGDFSKKEIIIWSWELLTEVWKLDKQRLWITVYKDDVESFDFWKNNTDVKPERILKFGDKDNFWEMGEVGPCGPCSEIHYYTGKNISDQTSKGVNKLDEYRELWNLVFIEFNRKKDGSLENLPLKHVDTGAGLERLVATLNGIDDHYKTDLFIPIIKKIEDISGFSYSNNDDVAHRVIADHIRMVSFSIADGIMPANEGRGYVVRRVLRRAARFGRVLNIKGPFLYCLVESLCDVLGDAYPELVEKNKHIIKVIKIEEESFGKTLDRGLILINEIINSLDNKIISGEQAFKLYDTFGFPVDLTRLIAQENECDVDTKSFERHMKAQRIKARGSHKFKDSNNQSEWNNILDSKGSNFIGYTSTSCNSKIVKYRAIDKNLEIVMDKTPFYAEAGGQIGDTGKIHSINIIFEVLDTYMVGDDMCHFCKLVKGDLNKDINNDFQLEIDINRRKKIKSNHTATHLLHKALKIVLGSHVQQAGSLVSDSKLRFDLTHYEKLSSSELSKIEKIVNDNVLENFQLEVKNENYKDAKKQGAEALFGEKYGDIVRVVSIADFSIELCGGTHVNRTGDIGLMKIISESSLASGIRRIEAVTGMEAIKYVNDKINIVHNMKQTLHCNSEDIINKVEELNKLSKENLKLKNELQGFQINDIFNQKVKSTKTISNLQFYQYEINFSIDVKYFIDKFSSQYKKNSIFLLGIKTDKPIIILSLTKDLTKNNNAGLIIKKVADQVGSGGGGPSHFGTAGFTDQEIYKKAFKLLLKNLNEI